MPTCCWRIVKNPQSVCGPHPVRWSSVPKSSMKYRREKWLNSVFF